jgi:hypothetical protein
MLPASARPRIFREGLELRDGSDPTLNNMSELIASCKISLLAKKLKVLAQRTPTLLQDEEQLRCTCAHPERGEAKERERDSVVSKIQKALNLVVPWKAYHLI